MSVRQSDRDVEMLSRIRAFIIDSQIGSPHHTTEALGIPPLSDDVAEMEEDASHERVSRIEHLIPLLLSYGKTIAKGHTLHARAHVPEDELESIPDTVWNTTASAYAAVASAALIGAVAQMVENGVLVLPKRRWFRR